MRYPPLYPHEVLGGVSHSCNIQARPSLPPLFFFQSSLINFFFHFKKEIPTFIMPAVAEGECFGTRENYGVKV